MASDTDAPISTELLDLLRCPETHQRLTLAPAELLRRVESENLRDRSGRAVAPMQAALLREDGAVLYPIRDRIPVMLVDEAIPLRTVQA